jgi:hypothetical protein
MIERHRDIGSEGALDFDRVLGGEEPGAAVDVAHELDALFGHLAEGLQGEDLKPARIGENRAAPGGEPMKPSQRPNHLFARAEMEVIGVAQDDLGPGPLDLLRMKPSDRA